MTAYDNRRTVLRALGLIALVAATALLSACGGASRPAAAPGTPQNPLVGKTSGNVENGRTSEATAHADTSVGYQKLVERQSSHPKGRFTPCNLVSRDQARAILGAPVMAPVEAPQGPTCIYRSPARKAFVTLAVQNADIGRLRRQMRNPRRVGVSHRAGFCGTFGQPMLYVAVSHKRVLAVAAPCPVATQFAARAVARLGG